MGCKFFAVFVCLAAGGCYAAPVWVRGKALSPTRTPVSGARLLVHQNGRPVSQQFTQLQGEFALELPAPGEYLLTVERDGFYPLREQVLPVAAEGREMTLVLEPVREVRDSVEVSSSPLSIDMDTTTPSRSVGATQILNIPYANTNDFRSAMRIVPGVIRDSRGGLHVNGAAEEQLLFTLNGFNVNDPLTGRFETRFSVESVHSVEIASGNLPAEYGKGSAGALAVRTHSGDDKFRYGATNFFPGFENRKGWTVGDWSPRLTLSGPLVRGRAWFSNAFDTHYSQTFIRDLPKGEDRYPSLRFSNMLHGQVNLTPSNILHTGFLMSNWNAARTGLTALDPLETTVDKRSRQWFFHAKDQVYFRGGALVEFGYAANRTFGRDIPQGHRMLQLTPFGKRGNHFVDSVREAARDQLLISGFLPSVSYGGRHQLKAGTDLNRLWYSQNVRRSGFESIDEKGRRVSRTVFGGNGALERANYEVAGFVQDSWRVRPGLLIETGIRTDWGGILHGWSPAPRFGFAWSPRRMENTKIYGGVASIYEASSLRLFTRPQDQFTLTSYFTPEGSVGRGPALSIYRIGNNDLARPGYRNMALGVEHHWPGSVAFRAEYLRRRGARGFTYRNSFFLHDAPAPVWAQAMNAAVVDNVYSLENFRRDRFDSVSFTVRQNIRRQYEWMVSYTRSRALSNAVVDVNVDDPIIVTDNEGPMPWDSPNRLMSWGYLPTPLKNWAVAYLLDARDGFPFSNRSGDGRFVGKVNAERFPYYFEVNLHLERRFAFRGHRWAWRMGANNLTNRINPDTVNSIVNSPDYLRFYGGTGRAYNFRIRWLGRK